MRFRQCMTGVLLFVLAATQIDAEEITNPQFECWKKFAEGSNSTITTVIENKGNKFTTVSTNKLVAKADDKMEIEISGTVDMLGQSRALPVQKQTVPAKMEKDKVPTQVAEATEKVEAAGKTFECKIYEFKRDVSGKPMTAKCWLSDEVPGGVVKMEAKTEEGGISAILKSFEAK